MQHLPDTLLPGRPFPLGATWDGLGINFAVFSANATRIDLCLFEPSGRHQIARYTLPEYTDEIWHGYLPDATRRPVVRLSRVRPVRAGPRASVQSPQAAARPVRARAGRRTALVGCAVRVSSAFSPARPVVRPAGQRAGDAEGRGNRQLVQLGRRSSPRRAVVRYGDLRGACARSDHPARRHPPIRARQLRRPRPSQDHRAPAPSRHHRDRTDAGACLPAGSRPAAARPAQLLGLQHTRLFRARTVLSVGRDAQRDACRDPPAARRRHRGDPRRRLQSYRRGRSDRTDAVVPRLGQCQLLPAGSRRSRGAPSTIPAPATR